MAAGPATTMPLAPGPGVPTGTAGVVPARITSLEVRDFRNIVAADLPVPYDGVVIVGDNGQGKTNLLEAVAYLEVLRSMRGARDRDLVRFGADAFHVGAHVAGAAAARVGVGASRGGAKRATLDGVACARLGDALGAVPSVCVSPADAALVARGPAERRRLLDIVLALTDAAYLHALRNYRAALARRNAALRARRQARAAAGAWDAALAAHGAVIVRARHAWAAALGGRFARLVEMIGETEPMAMAYASAFGAHADVAAEIAEALAAGRELDEQRGATQHGPHRDDLVLTMAGRPLRLSGSAGQHRTAAIALRLLEAETFRDRRRVQPVLLLDDPFAELDRRRAARVLDLLGDPAGGGAGQVVLCVPRADEIPAAYTRLARWRVRGGAFTPEPANG
ncbi:MAG: DNA replication and repair protein RecF [Gemmatimonadota bacterium]|nr:DNA replication and repair protein RecF [Gemmatimonadota bacterium]